MAFRFFAGAMLGAATHAALAPSSAIPTAFAQSSDLAENLAHMNLAQRFQAFASMGEGKYMSAEDFFASLCGVKDDHLPAKAKELFLTFDSNRDGVMSYAEYCLLFTLLSSRSSDLRVAFQMFDRDNNGAVDANEFAEIVKALSVDPTVKFDFNGGYMTKLFGEKKAKVLPFAEFCTMIDKLRDEVLSVEFAHSDPKNRGRISGSDMRQALFRHDPAKANATNAVEGVQVTRALYQKLATVLLDADNITRSMKVYCDAKEPKDEDKAAEYECAMTEKEFYRALNCGGTAVTRAESDTIFKIFDTDGSGKVEQEEFDEVVKLKGSFFAARVPDFKRPERNFAQQFAFCMQQRE